MRILALLLFLQTSQALAWYEDNETVMILAESGTPRIDRQSSDCPNRYSDQSLTHRLGTENVGWRPFCVIHEYLPSAVFSEVRAMAEYELENDSDYDQRITRMYVFKQEDLNPGTALSIETVKQLGMALGIPKKIIKGITFSSFIGDETTLGQFEGLYVGTDFVGDQTESLKYLRSQLMGKLVLEVTFGDGIELYPGGGFSVTHYLFILDGKLIFVKHSSWDA
jgi:hypothetical protein